MSTTEAPLKCASFRTCSMMAASYDECSSATRMRLYISAHPGTRDLHEQPRVEGGDRYGDDVRQGLEPARVDECSHLRPIGGEAHQWKDRERELQAEHDLAED